MAETGSDQILIVTSIEEKADDQRRRERGLGDRLTQGVISAISVSELKKNVESFFAQLKEILDTGVERIGRFEVDQVEISAQITGEGKVCLMGSGVQLGAEGGIKFVLKRASN
ncbi:MAG: hypothetical protein PVF76_16460 [Syntrophobacterales bacterium]|jgi:hypothetical protein